MGFLFKSRFNIIMKTIQKQYRLKEEPTAPKQYLGAVIKQWNIPNEQRPVCPSVQEIISRKRYVA